MVSCERHFDSAHHFWLIGLEGVGKGGLGVSDIGALGGHPEPLTENGSCLGDKYK